MIAEDKQLHIIAGAILGFLIGALCALGVGPLDGWVLGAISGGLVGAAKEVWDADTFGRTADFRDAVATLAGSIVGSSVAALIVWSIL